MNFITGKIEKPREISISIRDGRVTIRLIQEIKETRIGTEITVGIRPEKITPYFSQQEKSIPCILEVVEHWGMKRF